MRRAGAGRVAPARVPMPTAMLRSCELVRVAPVWLVVAACSRGPARPVGPPPGEGHRAAIAERHDAAIGARYPLAGPSAFRFDAPEPLRVAAWHWEPQDDGRTHTLAYAHGWGVRFDVTPRYQGYPAQPVAQRMAFFVEGTLRGLFARGGDTAPLELDAWSPLWVDPAWRPPDTPPAAPPR
jgi:hypothetical protein